MIYSISASHLRLKNLVEVKSSLKSLTLISDLSRAALYQNQL